METLPSGHFSPVLRWDYDNYLAAKNQLKFFAPVGLTDTLQWYKFPFPKAGLITPLPMRIEFLSVRFLVRNLL